jgi:hypothetical protein
MITKIEKSLLEHTLGGKDPQKWYRNHFCASPGHPDLPHLKKLEENGMMKELPAPSFCDKDTILFVVTEKGKDFLSKE